MTVHPKEIISKLLSTLIESALYAKRVQSKIKPLAEKIGTKNLFAAALSDADLSVQTHVELALLANFPSIPFYGEEWEISRNTKYFSGKYFVDSEPYLITLDPIDGTRLYLDGQKEYQIILTVISRDSFEAVIVLFPCYDEYVYAIRGDGAFRATFDTTIEKARQWKLTSPPQEIYIGSDLKQFLPKLKESFKVVHCSHEYSKEVPIPFFNSLLNNQLCGAAISNSQIIDGAALAFVAQEMGYQMQTLDGKPLPKIIEYPDLILPGMIVAENTKIIQQIRECCTTTK
ncbi:MAG: inositol monophosphatase family protein [bacterium]|nr:inositol monophosphatase family protein [bacterium]